MSNTSRLVIIIVLFTGCQIVLAQNPLRAVDSNQLSQQKIQLVQNRNSPASNEVPNVSRYQNLLMRPKELDSDAEVEPVRIDMSVAPVSFEQVPKRTTQSDSDTSNPNSLTAMVDSNFHSHSHVLDLIMKISLNLVFVLSFAVGIMLIIRRRLQNANGSQGASWRTTGDSLCVRETLRVDNRTTIRLVQWRSNRFLIACDQNGIQSVNALNAAFDQTLQELDSEPTDKKTLERLLAGLNLE